jgi:hypothetical protein
MSPQVMSNVSGAGVFAVTAATEAIIIAVEFLISDDDP